MDNHISQGNVYVMTHSFFQMLSELDAHLKIHQIMQKKISANSPGEYTLVFSLACANPCDVQKQVRLYLNAQKYVNEFYQVSPEIAAKLLTRETLRIPIVNTI